MRLLDGPPHYIALDRPCRLGDGIRPLDAGALEAALRDYEKARLEGRLARFVPASGAASRMFQALLWARHECADSSRASLQRQAAAGNANAGDVLTFVDNIGRFAFYDDLRDVMARRGLEPAELVAAASCPAARLPADRSRPRLRIASEGAAAVPSLCGPQPHGLRGAPERGGRVPGRKRRRRAAPLHRFARAPRALRSAAGGDPPSPSEALRRAARGRLLGPEAIDRHVGGGSRRPALSHRRWPASVPPRRTRRPDRESERSGRRPDPRAERRQRAARAPAAARDRRQEGPAGPAGRIAGGGVPLSVAVGGRRGWRTRR